jgi:hypothetical protein
MPPFLCATKETYAHILAWGENNSNEWYHPVSRPQFAQGLSTLQTGDTIEFFLDGVSSKVQILNVGEIYDYPLLKHINGEFNLSNMYVDRVIHVKRI